MTFSIVRPARLLVVPVLILAVLPCAARADNLDTPLTGKGWRIISALKEEKVQNVGVLPFRVKKGTRPESFIAGPINTGMANRVENALIMNEPREETSAIGIIHGASATASKAKVGDWYTRPAERKKLFDVTYDLAWGNKKVKADAFLTGLITNVGDREKTEVVIQAIYKSDPAKLVEVARFTVDSDRSLLSDLGYNFQLSRNALTRARTSQERNKLAAGIVSRRDAGQPARLDQGEPATPDNVGGLSVAIKYDGADQEIRPLSEGVKGTEYFVPPVKASTKFQIALTYNGKRDDKVGAIIKVNGISTWQLQTGDSINLQKWLYNKDKNLGKPDVFDGYYMDVDGKNLKPWAILTGEDARTKAAQMGERVGWIDIDVFASDEKLAKGDDRMTISTRSMVRGRSSSKPTTLKEAQEQLYKANFVKRRLVRGRDEDGGLIAPSEDSIEAGKLEQGSLPDAVLIGSLHIKYYNPSETQMQITK